MVYDYSKLSQCTEDWLQQAYELGWIQEMNTPSFSPQESISLFKDATRPLMVAFMGGTGVGKSSLLNRLAGKPIAKAGVARPTSKEITLFHHQEMILPSLPLKDIRVASHDDDAQKNIVWIDMPDFDSTNAHNKELVLNWLPCIDVLIYVVSPERYRDEKAWRLLLTEGANHAWLFVMNQCDRGQLEQLSDFEKQLKIAGFTAPLIFKTCCTESVENDEFRVLSDTLISLATQKTVEQLTHRSTHIHIQLLQSRLQNYLVQFGNETALKKLHSQWQANWKATATQLQQGFAWKVQPLAEYFAHHASDFVNSTTPLSLWDNWAQSRFEDALNTLIVDAQSLELPTTPLEIPLLSLRENAQQLLHSHVEFHTRQALAQRGNFFQRTALKFVAAAEIVLPLSAMSWVGFQVVSRYYESNQSHTPYLSVDFAVHSLLVCGLAWLVPFFILKKCQPSLKRCALRGFNKGILQGLENLNEAVNTAQQHYQTQRTAQLEKLCALLTECDVITKIPVEMNESGTLNRMLVSKQ